MLRGRCRRCRAEISGRYPLVEALTGCLFALVFYLYFDRSVGVAVVYSAAAAALVAATFIDIDYQIIPDEITIGGAVLGPVASFIVPALHIPASGVIDPARPWAGGVPGVPQLAERYLAALGSWSVRIDAVGASLLGLLVGGGVIATIGILGKFVFRKEAMGFGDVKLMAFVGSVIGWRAIPLVIFGASVVGILYFLVGLTKKNRGEGQVAFGPALATATIVVMLGWQPFFEGVMNYYVELF